MPFIELLLDLLKINWSSYLDLDKRSELLENGFNILRRITSQRDDAMNFVLEYPGIISELSDIIVASANEPDVWKQIRGFLLNLNSVEQLPAHLERMLSDT